MIEELGWLRICDGSVRIWLNIEDWDGLGVRIWLGFG